MVKILIEGGADFNRVLDDQTPLSLAIGKQDAAMVRILADAGADPNVKVSPTSEWELTSPTLWIGKPEIVEILLGVGADPNVIDTEQFYDEAPLSIAVKAQDTEMVKVLIAAERIPTRDWTSSERQHR